MIGFVLLVTLIWVGWVYLFGSGFIGCLCGLVSSVLGWAWYVGFGGAVILFLGCVGFAVGW